MGIGSTLYTAPKNAILTAIRGVTGNSQVIHTYVIGFSNWKQYLRSYFPDRELHFIAKDITAAGFAEQWAGKIQKRSRAEFFVWGYKAPEFISDFAKANNKTVWYVEDGFVRSVQLGASQAPARSLTLDKRTPYFNAREASGLEEMLMTYDFQADSALLDRAKTAIAEMLRLGISKYNSAPSVDMRKLYGAKKGKRVLVLGQVEDDASIMLGCDKAVTNNDLVRLAYEENPGAQIIYKPHPDVLSGKRPRQSDPAEVKDIALVVKKDVPMPLAFHQVDHVYTITSLAGFEALLRGIKVTAYGCPFYAGWGVTDDRQPNPRRTRKLSVTEIFAIAYLRYPLYFDLASGKRVEHEDVVQGISREMGGIPKSINSVDSPKSEASDIAAANAVVKPVGTIAAPGVGAWFNPQAGSELRAALGKASPLFLYLPWDAAKGDLLLEQLHGPQAYTLAAFDLFRPLGTAAARAQVERFAVESPDLFRHRVLSRLTPIRNQVAGMLFTFDWSPLMRIISSVCEELQMPRILIPHEPMLRNRDAYYCQDVTRPRAPCADLVLGWGDLQRDIFCERGYPAERFVPVGAVALDAQADYLPKLSREQFCQVFGLAPERDIILFTADALDLPLGVRDDKPLQLEAITDLLVVAEELGAQLLLRLAPGLLKRLDEEVLEQLAAFGAAIDEGAYHVVTAEEAVFHCALATAVDSLTLFMALVMNRPALSLQYVEPGERWSEAGVAVAGDAHALRENAERLLTEDWQRSEQGLEWAAHKFSVGAFDGQAVTRIQQHLAQLARDPGSVSMRPTAMQQLFKRQPIEVGAIPSPEAVIAGIQQYLQPMLGARALRSTISQSATYDEFSDVDLFFQWGITESVRKNRQREWARRLGKPIVYIEDGFIRSLDIGLSQEPGMSIIMDDKTSYYDATKPSRLEQLYQSGPELSAEQIARARGAIDLIVNSRVSKYNHAPDVPFNLGEKGRKKVLLVDQRFGDQSVTSGLADEKSFEYMLQDVLTHRSDCDILIKQHPDAIKGGKSSYFSNERLAITQYMDNVYPILFDINPFALFDIVDEVYVVTSGMGFEALMAGKTVHCYGVPFYAGWGLTHDQKTLPRRTRTRSLEEVFHFAYIESSRYFHPGLDRVAEVEEVVQYIKEKKAER